MPLQPMAGCRVGERAAERCARHRVQGGCAPPELSRAVITVEFPAYVGPAGYKDRPRHVPIVPSRYEGTVGSRRGSRIQLPLMLAFGITIHKSQDMTVGPGQWATGHPIQRVVVDIGKRGTAGARPASPSWLCPGLRTCSAWPRTHFDRLVRISKLAQMKARKAHDTRLQQCARRTKERLWCLVEQDPMFGRRGQAAAVQDASAA